MTIERVFNRYYVTGLSDCGKCREINEDNILLNPQAGVFLLADGMGGHRDGAQASDQAVKLINTLIEKHLPIETDPATKARFGKRFFGLFNSTAKTASPPNPESQSELLTDILNEANRVIYRCNMEAGFEEGGKGTTLVGCRITPNSNRMHVFHVGDSRLYRLRDNNLCQITKDHSMYQLWLDGGQIGESPTSNRLYQGIGPAPIIKPEVQVVDIEADDAFLLCSDGLTGMVSDTAIAEILQGIGPDNIDEKALALIDIANQNGGTDNISVILICP